MVVTNFCQFISASAQEQLTFPGQNGRYFANGILRSICVKEKFYILIKISLKFVPKGPVYNNPALAQIMAWHQISDKPLCKLMLTRFMTLIYVALGVDELSFIYPFYSDIT